MKKLISLVVLMAILFAARPSTAQTQQSKCDPGGVIKKAAVLTSTGDNKTDMAALIALSQDISAVNIACSGLTFSGTGAKVSDPFDLPEGKYRMKLTLKANALILVELSDANDVGCSGEVDNDKLEDLVDSSGCRAILTVKTYTGAPPQWQISFEPLK